MPVMDVACPHCGELTPGDARYCTACGSALGSRAPLRHAGAAGPTLRLDRPHAPGRAIIGPRDGIPLIGLLFGTLFLVAWAQLLASGWLRAFGPWPIGL